MTSAAPAANGISRNAASHCLISTAQEIGDAGFKRFGDVDLDGLVHDGVLQLELTEALPWVGGPVQRSRGATMRKMLVLTIALLAGTARAQPSAEIGSPEAAFAGGPIRPSKTATETMRKHFQGDKVPIIPQPWRGKLDAALAVRDWALVETRKKELAAARGLVLALLWEQTRFLATGAIGLAELHAKDVAATGSTGVSETAAMLWFYAVAATMTDGHKCANEAAKDAHLDKLRGPAFDSVIKVVKAMPEDRLVAMRDLAIRLETVLGPDRNDDTICAAGAGKPEIKPDAAWRPDASKTRAMLPKHLIALSAIMRPKPVAAQTKPEKTAAKPDRPKTAP